MPFDRGLLGGRRSRSTMASIKLAVDLNAIRRDAESYFRRFDRMVLLEAICRRQHQFAFNPEKMTDGLMRFCQETKGLDDVILLFPVEDTMDSLPVKLEELHQIIRELVTGIYVFNETPDIKLEYHHDNSGAALCLLPAAYHDTRVGQAVINALAGANCLLHNVKFPSVRRRRFAENWRETIRVGKREKTPQMKDISEIYAEAGLQEVTKLSHSQTNNYGSMDIPMQIGITVRETAVHQYSNIFLVDPQWDPTSYLMFDDGNIDIVSYTEGHRHLQSQFDGLRQSMRSNPETFHDLILIQFIHCMICLLSALKARCKVPDISTLCSPLKADDLKTERELPPLYVKNRHCGSAINPHLMPHEGFITFYKGVYDCSLADFLKDECDKVVRAASYSDPDQFKQSQIILDGRLYIVLPLKLESYYSTSPYLPAWIHAMVSELSTQAAGIPTLTDSRMQEIIRYRMGSRKASKLNSSNALLVISAQRGLNAVIQVVGKRSAKTRLSKASDDDGLALVHHAALHDQVSIIHWLAQQGGDLNVRRQCLAEGQLNSISVSEIGETALHIAARSGCLDSVCCLILNEADSHLYDVINWQAIHHASFHNHSEIVSHLVLNDVSLLESKTMDSRKATPLMQATLGGALDTVKRLVKLGADLSTVDGLEKSLVHAAAMNMHINILLFYAQCDSPSLRIWELLVGMLKSPLETREPELAACCLDPLTTAYASYWEKLLKSDGVVALSDLLKSSDRTVQANVAMVLQNISGNDDVRRAIIAAGAIPDLVALLKTDDTDIQSRCSVVLGDVGSIDENYDSIAEEGAIQPLVSLLHSNDPAVQLNSANCIRVLVDGNGHNQATFLSFGGMQPLVNLLNSKSDIVQACAAETIKAACTRFKQGQDSAVDEGGIRLLIILLRSQNPRVQIQAAGAMEAIADSNAKAQNRIMFGDETRTHPIGTHALKRLLKFKTVDLKIHGASALWAVAGTTIANQRHIASLIGIDMLVQLLSLPNERLAIVSAQAIHALSSGPAEFRNRICESGGVLPLVRLLKPQLQSSSLVLVNVMRTLVSLCVGPANTPHTINQNTIVEGRGVYYLVELMDEHSDPLVRAKAAWVLASISLRNMPVQQSIVTNPDFNFVSILQMMTSDSEEVRLCAGMALATFAYNSSTHQKAIADVGGIQYSLFESFLYSKNESHRGHAALQSVVLAKVISGPGEIAVAIRGLETLILLLTSQLDESRILAGDFLASLAHTRAGIPSAIVAAGGVKLLLSNLASNVEAVVASAAVALGYLSFNRTAAREMMTAMRNEPELFDVFRHYTFNGKVSPQFLDSWTATRKVGLPALSLETKGGPPVITDRLPLDGRSRLVVW